MGSWGRGVVGSWGRRVASWGRRVCGVAGRWVCVGSPPYELYLMAKKI